MSRRPRRNHSAAFKATETSDLRTPTPTFECWHCDFAMLILQTLTRDHGPGSRAPPSVHTQ
jgi:hypothetical protein